MNVTSMLFLYKDKTWLSPLYPKLTGRIILILKSWIISFINLMLHAVNLSTSCYNSSFIDPMLHAVHLSIKYSVDNYLVICFFSIFSPMVIFLVLSFFIYSVFWQVCNNVIKSHFTYLRFLAVNVTFTNDVMRKCERETHFFDIRHKGLSKKSHFRMTGAREGTGPIYMTSFMKDTWESHQ